jgi:hypothetical protein
MNLMRILRAASKAVGVSFVVLLGMAMPLK